MKPGELAWFGTRGWGIIYQVYPDGQVLAWFGEDLVLLTLTVP